MAIKAVFFDLDGTLLPMDQEEFTKAYFSRLSRKLLPLGYEPKLLIDSVWKSTAAMIMNNGKCTNEEAFWDKFASIHGDRVYADKPFFDEFYSNEFEQISEVCGKNPYAAQIVKQLQDKGIMLVLATNPIFPAVATKSRMGWVGLKPSDFALFTSYENSSYCKPNLQYYTSICEQLGLDPKDCLMVGNDVSEDMIAEKLGMKVFLVTDCLINKENKDISSFANGGFAQLQEYLNNLF